jgi:hypothetical protein
MKIQRESTRRAQELRREYREIQTVSPKGLRI